MKQSLTPKQQKIYSYVRQYIIDHSLSPTLDEVRQFFNVGSINTVVDHLKALERKGYLFRTRHAKRNIELRSDPHMNSNATLSIPVVSSVGCDDLSVFVNHKHDEFIEVDSKVIGTKKDVVAVRALGNSMLDADIHNGDYVLVELTQTAQTGDRVVAIVGDMVTIKKLEKGNGVVILRPESRDPKYKPIIMSEDFQIAGKVITTIPGDSQDMTSVVPL